MDLLGLSEEELCTILDADALTLLSGQLDHRPELKILLELLAEPEEQTGKTILRRWVRATGPTGKPIDHLEERDFQAFERRRAAQRTGLPAAGRGRAPDA